MELHEKINVFSSFISCRRMGHHFEVRGPLLVSSTYEQMKSKLTLTGPGFIKDFITPKQNLVIPKSQSVHRCQ